MIDPTIYSNPRSNKSLLYAVTMEVGVMPSSHGLRTCLWTSSSDAFQDEMTLSIQAIPQTIHAGRQISREGFHLGVGRGGRELGLE